MTVCVCVHVFLFCWGGHVAKKWWVRLYTTTHCCGETHAVMSLRFSSAIVETDHIPSNMPSEYGILRRCTCAVTAHPAGTYTHPAFMNTPPSQATAHSGPIRPAAACLPSTPAHTSERLQRRITPTTLGCIRAGLPAHVADAGSQLVDGPDSVRVLQPQHPLLQLQHLAVQWLRLRVPVAR